MVMSLLTYLLVSNAVTLRRDKSILFSRVVIISLLLTSYLAYSNLYLSPLHNGIGLFGGLFNVTTITQSFNIFLFLISSVILTLTGFYPRKISLAKHSSLYSLLFYKLSYNKNFISNKAGEQYRIIEYALIIVFIICGAVFLMSTGDLVSVFLSIELQSYGLYILSTIYRNSESSTASGLTYFLLGGLSSCFILLGSSLLYANSGNTNLDNIYIIANLSDFYYMNSLLYDGVYIDISLIILCIGFLFKVSAAPFHFWSPDVYDGIPTIVTTYVAIVAKISIFIFLLEIVYYTKLYYVTFSWKVILTLSSLFSLIIGSVLGLTQSRIKRLFAYSTISHVGFILLALSIESTESIQSYLFYILQYSISNLNAFIILIAIGYSLYFYVHKSNSDAQEYSENSNFLSSEINSSLPNAKLKGDKINSPIQFISQIKGYFYINPFIAISLATTLFSFVGIPPIIGFFAKQMVLSAALDNGYVFMTFIAILTSVIGAGYYLNLIKQIFFFKSDYEMNPVLSESKIVAYATPFSLQNIQSNNKTKNSSIVYNGSPFTLVNNKETNDKMIVSVNSSLSTSISILTLLLLLFIYIPGEWFNIVSILSLILFKS